jgi:Protein of unknown function (DUF732)
MTTFDLDSSLVDADDTDAPDREATVIVPSAAPTDLVELAWSSDVDVPDELPTDRYTWRATWAHVAVFIVCAAVLAGALGFGTWVWVRHRDMLPPASHSISAAIQPPATRLPAAAAPPPVAAQVPPTVAPPRAAEPPPIPPPTPDDRFLAALRDHGIRATDGADAEIAGAHAVCVVMGSGQKTPSQVATELQANNPTATDSTAQFFVAAAIAIYCPQYR